MSFLCAERITLIEKDVRIFCTRPYSVYVDVIRVLVVPSAYTPATGDQAVFPSRAVCS